MLRNPQEEALHRQDKVLRSLQEHESLLAAEVRQIDADILLQQKMVKRYNEDGFERGIARLAHLKEQKAAALERVQQQLTKLDNSVASGKKLADDLNNIQIREQILEARKEAREMERVKIEMEKSGLRFDEELFSTSPTVTDHFNSTDVGRLEDIDNPVIYKQMNKPSYIAATSIKPKPMDNPFMSNSPILQHKSKQLSGKQKFSVPLYDMSV
jgi:hypothetical protein